MGISDRQNFTSSSLPFASLLLYLLCKAFLSQSPFGEKYTEDARNIILNYGKPSLLACVCSRRSGVELRWS